MRVLVAGSSSATGRYLCERLLASGHEVVGLNRAGRGIGGVHHVAGDVTRPHTVEPALEGVDAVVSLVGASLWPIPRVPDTTFLQTDRDGNIALFEAARRAGVQRLVYLSVFGEYPADLRYVSAHREVEAWLAGCGVASSVVRTTGLFEVFDVFRSLGRLGFSIQLGNGLARTNPIHEADLADVLAHALEEPGVVDCGGPETWSRAELAAMALKSGRGPVLRVPAGLAGLQARGLGLVSQRCGDILRFLQHVTTHEAVAPAHGTHSIRAWFSGSESG